MKFKVKLSNPHQALRSLGYHENTNQSGKLNFVRRLRSGQSWPRYHLYVSLNGPETLLDLHVDQKAETRHYKAEIAHNGEHDGPLVEQEVERIKNAL